MNERTRSMPAGTLVRLNCPVSRLHGRFGTVVAEEERQVIVQPISAPGIPEGEVVVSKPAAVPLTRPYGCPWCADAFASQALLDAHLRRQTDAGCDRSCTCEMYGHDDPDCEKHHDPEGGSS